MKRVLSFAFALVIAFLLANPASACTGPYCSGWFNLESEARQGVDDKSFRGWKNHGTMGSYDAEGYGHSALSGWGGDIEGHTEALGGALGKTESYKFDPEIGDTSFGIGSVSQAEAISGAGLEGEIEGKGHLSGSISGGIDMKTGANSWYGGNWKDPDTRGFAHQGACGSFQGAHKSGADQGYSAYINARGLSYSESYGYEITHEGLTTVGKGTNVGTQTALESGVDNMHHETPVVTGGWETSGMAGTETHQTHHSGFATAKALGAYSCSGHLGQGFEGMVDGYSHTSVTTVDGWNGSINRAESGMKVESKLIP